MASGALSAKSAFDLRLRLLETLVCGKSPAGASSTSKPSVARRANDVVKRLEEALEGSGGDAVRRFVEGYDLNRPLLYPPTPAEAADFTSELTPQVKATLILEAEGDIRSTERDLRELDALEKRGVAGAGTLSSYEELRPNLVALQAELPGLTHSFADLEVAVSDLLGRYNAHVSLLSEIFIAWNSIICTAEEAATRWERARLDDSCP